MLLFTREKFNILEARVLMPLDGWKAQQNHGMYYGPLASPTQWTFKALNGRFRRFMVRRFIVKSPPESPLNCPLH